jgi:hypothetical protein
MTEYEDVTEKEFEEKSRQKIIRLNIEIDKNEMQLLSTTTSNNKMIKQ